MRLGCSTFARYLTYLRAGTTLYYDAIKKQKVWEQHTLHYAHHRRLAWATSCKQDWDYYERLCIAFSGKIGSFWAGFLGTFIEALCQLQSFFSSPVYSLISHSFQRSTMDQLAWYP